MQIVAELECDKACVEDLGAVNRWSPLGSELRGNPRARSAAGSLGAITEGFGTLDLKEAIALLGELHA